MKIAWFTPFSTTSAIGRASSLITAELGKLAEVDIWHPEAQHTYHTPLKTIAYPPSLDIDATMLAVYDIAIYNLGNHLPFHRQIFESSRRAPGIVILHDIVMHHFFASYYLEHVRAPAAYMDAMVRCYGERGRRSVEAGHGGTAPWVWETDDVMSMPLFEEAVRGAWGAVVHSNFFAERVAKAFAGPVKMFPLPYKPAPAGQIEGRKELGLTPGRTLMVTVGHVNRNKRVDSVLRALAARPDVRGMVEYVIAGPIEGSYKTELEKLLHSDGTAAVHFVGRVSDERLQSYIAHAELCIALRYPATEGASASVIEEMMLGKAVIVTDTGFYHELPDNTVYKISPERETAELEQALVLLLGNGAYRREVGTRAKRYAESMFRADRYAEGILEFAKEILRDSAFLRYTDRIGDILSDMGVKPEMPIVDKIAQISADLFEKRG